jgi:hypothetical protein
MGLDLLWQKEGVWPEAGFDFFEIPPPQQWRGTNRRPSNAGLGAASGNA